MVTGTSTFSFQLCICSSRAMLNVHRMHEKEGLTMAFKDQVKKFEGRNVRVETRNGTFFGKLVEVKSTTIILRENENNCRTIIRDSQIIAVTEHNNH